MPYNRFAYLPLITYPEPVSDDAIEAAVEVAAALGCEVHATTFSADIPSVSTPIGGLLINIPEMIRTAEENSHNHCGRLQKLVVNRAGSRVKTHCSTRKVHAGSEGDAAAVEARYFDLTLLPLGKSSVTTRDHAQSVIFGAGRPAILIPPSAKSEPLKRVAVAWDGSRVAARALADVMPFLGDDTQLTIVTVQGEKALAGQDIAEALAASLELRGYSARAQNVTLGGRKIAEALQEAALESGSGLLVMGGFGHSRLRDFILGGATQGVFVDPRLPILLSH